MAISASDVKKLRDMTGAGMMDAKRALESSAGDFEAAKKWLRENGLVQSLKRQDRDASEGAICISQDSDQRASIAKLQSETDFVAKSPEFVEFCQKLADKCLESGEEIVRDYDEELEDLKLKLKENIQLVELKRFEASSEGSIGTYLHVQNGRGVNAVVVEIDKKDPELAHDLALHIAFAKPKYINRSDVPTEMVESEKNVILEMEKKTGKPESQLQKIVEGKLNGWFREIVLLEQPFVKDEKKKVSDILGDIKVVRFEQALVGT